MGFFAEVGARLGLDIKPFEQGLARSAKSLGDFKKRAGKNLEAGDAGKALALALGLSIERMGETVARLWTGISENAEESFKNIERLSSSNTDESIRQMRELLTMEQKYQLLLADRKKLQNNIAPQEDFLSGAWEKALLMMSATPNPLQRWAQAKLDIRATELGAKNKEEELKKDEELLKNSAEIRRNEEDRRQRIEEIAKKEEANNRDAMSTADQLVAAHYDLLAIDKLLGSDPTAKLELDLARADKIKQIRELTLKNEREIESAAEKAAQVQEKAAREAERVADATDRAAKAWMDLELAKDDRTALTLEEVARGGSGVSQTDKVKAKEIQRLEAQARRQRAQGFSSESEASQAKADALREGFGLLKSDDRQPLRGQNRALTDAFKDLDDAKKGGDGLVRAAGQLSTAASDMKSAAATVSGAFQNVPVQ